MKTIPFCGKRGRYGKHGERLPLGKNHFQDVEKRSPLRTLPDGSVQGRTPEAQEWLQRQAAAQRLLKSLVV